MVHREFEPKPCVKKHTDSSCPQEPQESFPSPVHDCMKRVVSLVVMSLVVVNMFFSQCSIIIIEFRKALSMPSCNHLRRK
jgi:hypothetical protein